MNTVKLKNCDTFIEAHIIKGRLENECISCFLINENFFNLMPHYCRMLGAGIQIFVYESDYDHAFDLVNEIDEYKINNWRSNKFACPYCGSSKVGFGLGPKKNYKWKIILISIIFGIPFNNINCTFFCEDCDTVF